MRAGNYSMAGYGGNDRLDGGTGADSMVGGIGNDTYVVDHIGDAVIEKYNEGYDTVETLLNNYQLTNNVEALKLRSVSGVTTGRGNNLNNRRRVPMLIPFTRRRASC